MTSQYPPVSREQAEVAAIAFGEIDMMDEGPATSEFMARHGHTMRDYILDSPPTPPADAREFVRKCRLIMDAGGNCGMTWVFDEPDLATELTALIVESARTWEPEVIAAAKRLKASAEAWIRETNGDTFAVDDPELVNWRDQATVARAVLGGPLGDDGAKYADPAALRAALEELRKEYAKAEIESDVHASKLGLVVINAAAISKIVSLLAAPEPTK